MRKVVAILLCYIAPFSCYAQGAVFAWAKQLGQTSHDQANCVAVDLAGNVYTTGKIGYNAFISKHNSAGNLIWLKQMTGTSFVNNAAGVAITTDVSGNVLLTGKFTGTIDFDPGPGTYNLTGISDHQFISKLDGSGNFIWTKQIGGNILGHNVFVSSIATDLLGNVYTAGSIDGPTIDFDPGPAVYPIAVSYYNEIFVSKLNANGIFAWAKIMYEAPGGMAFHGSWATAIALDGAGNVYTTGRFANTIDFDPGLAAFDLHHTTDLCDAFVSKLDSNGNFVWAKQFKGQYFDAFSYGSSIVIDATGNVYTTGSCSDSVDLDPGPGTYYFTQSSFGYICKLDAGGNFIFALPISGQSLALDPSGNMYATGTFIDTTDFDPGQSTFTLTPIGSYNAYIFKLNPSGNLLWAKQMGGTSATGSQSIALDTARSIFTAGYFRDTTDFDPELPVYNLVSSAGDDIFVHKLSQCVTSTSSTVNATACSAYILNGQTYNVSGVYTQTIVNATGCDSIITLNLTISPIIVSVNIISCKSYTWNSQVLTTSGIYKDALVASNGCDSIVTLNLTITNINATASATACKSYTWHNHIYYSSGTYKDTLLTTNGCDSVVTLNLTIIPPLTSTVAHTICRGQTYSGHSASGVYVDTLTATNGCDSIRTLQLTVLPRPAVNLGLDKILCSGDSLILYPGQFVSYTWQDGSNQSQFTVRQPGTYSVTIRTASDSVTDTIMITGSSCDVYFPSAFTPDGDGKNDRFKVLGSHSFKEYHLMVFNRWGQKVFETYDPAAAWDGSFNGRKQLPAAFVWYCEFNKAGNPGKTKLKGVVVLIR